MYNNIYEVDRDEYAAFIGQLNKEKMDTEVFSEPNAVFIKVKSIKTGKHLSTRVISKYEENYGEEKYYIFNYPENEERVEPKAIRKIVLETKEEVQSFLEALGKIQKGEYKHD